MDCVQSLIIHVTLRDKPDTLLFLNMERYGNHIPKDCVTNVALVCQKSNRRLASIVLGHTYKRRSFIRFCPRLRDKFESRVIIKVSDNLRSCDVA